MAPSDMPESAADIQRQLERSQAQLLRSAQDLQHLLEAERLKPLALAEAHAKLRRLDQLKSDFLRLKHSIANHPLGAQGGLRFVQDWVGHKSVQNTTKYTQLTNSRRDEEARKLFANHRVV